MSKKQPERSCVACRQVRPKSQLVRLVRRIDGGVSIDRSGRASGRGAYVCFAPDCWQTAQKRRCIDRSLDITVTAEEWVVLSAFAAEHSEQRVRVAQPELTENIAPEST